MDSARPNPSRSRSARSAAAGKKKLPPPTPSEAAFERLLADFPTPDTSQANDDSVVLRQAQDDAGAHDALRQAQGDIGVFLDELYANARAYLAVQKEFGSFSQYLWGFVKDQKVGRRLGHYRQLPVTTPESDAMSKDLKKRGFNFVGSTICYAFMQAAGMVDDHLEGCFRSKK